MKAVIVILRTVITLLIVMLLVVNLTLLVSGSVNTGKPPQVASYYLLVMESSDMEPTLTHGDVVVITEKSQYELGEVISYIKSDEVVVHRIVGTNDSGYITQGDANEDTDETLLTAPEILGGAVMYLPSFSWILEWMMTPVCTTVLILVWVLLILLPMRLERRAVADVR